MAKSTSKNSTKSTKSKSKSIGKSEILEAFMDFVNEYNRPPASIYKFMKDLGESESKFYEFFGSFDGITPYFWERVIDGSIKTCKSDDAWDTYMAKDRMLAFYFTLFENLNLNRSFGIWALNNMKMGSSSWKAIHSVKDDFKIFANEIVRVGLESEELLERPFISKRYDEALWAQFLFLVRFWKNDDSASFENTDAAIEKSVSLSFELMGKGPLDSILDFGKFIINTKGFKR